MAERSITHRGGKHSSTVGSRRVSISSYEVPEDGISDDGMPGRSSSKYTSRNTGKKKPQAHFTGTASATSSCVDTYPGWAAGAGHTNSDLFGFGPAGSTASSLLSLRTDDGFERLSTGFERLPTGFDRLPTGFDRLPTGYPPPPLPMPYPPPPMPLVPPLGPASMPWSPYPPVPYPPSPYTGLMPGGVPPYGMVPFSNLPYPGMMPYPVPPGGLPPPGEPPIPTFTKQKSSKSRRDSDFTSHKSSPPASQPAGDSKSSTAPKTTIMLRNLPEGYTRDCIKELLDSQGFDKLFNFLYVPMNFRKDTHFGYAFVNFISNEAAEACRTKMEGFRDWGVETTKVLEVSWSDMHQGIDAHVLRYMNSPVMHEDVDDKYKPALFQDGVRKPFPPPTKNIRPPRVRRPTGPDDGSAGNNGDDE